MTQRRLFKLFKGHVLSSKEVCRLGVSEILSDTMNKEYIKQNFSTLVTDTQLKAYEIFLNSQQEAWSKTIDRYVTDYLAEETTRSEVTEFLTENFVEFNSFFLSLTNSRRPRAGSAFQYIIKDLFIRLGYPFEEQAEIDGKPDFILPSVQHFNENPMDCIILTIKRSLRERWRQITTEGKKGLGFFLATIDNGLSENALKEMLDNRIYVVVPEELKKEIDHYSRARNVISYEAFFEDYLDPAVERWERKGILPIARSP